MIESVASPLVVLAALIGVVAYVAWPLRRARLAADGAAFTAPALGGDLARLADERRSVLTALRELDRDRELGNLTAEDHAALRDDYEQRALALYPALDAALKEREAALASAVAAERERLAHEHADALASAPAGDRVDDARRAPGALVPNGHASALGGEALYASDAAVDAGTHDAAHAGVPASNGHARAPVDDANASGADARNRRPGAVVGARDARRSPAAAPAAARPRSSRLALLISFASAVLLAALGTAWYLTSGAGRATPIATVRAPDYHVLVSDPSALYMGTHTGLYVSHDRGAHWTLARDADGDVMSVVPVPGALLAAGHEIFLRSLDAGATWQPFDPHLPGLDVHAMAASPSNPKRLYAAVVGQGFFKSDDAGASWATAGRMPASIVGLAVVPGTGDSELLYGATLQEGVLASADGGRSWTSANGFVNGALPTRQVNAVAYDGRSGDTNQGAASSFKGALFVSTDRGAFRSTDGGLSWSKLGLDGDVSALAIASDDPRVLYAVDSGGRIYRSSNRGVSWNG